MALYLSLVVSFLLKLGIKNFIWYVLNNNKSHIFTLKYYEFHIQVYSFQKVDR